MRKHQEMEHEGEKPDFVMRVVGSHRSALSRQVFEAVRIRRRGGEGSILNSKTEYNRCHIPRLRVEEKEETRRREQEIELEKEQTDRELELEQRQWESGKTSERDRERRELLRQWSNSSIEEGSKKRSVKEQETEGKRSKRRKFALLGEEWGSTSTAREEQEGAGKEGRGGGSHDTGELQIPSAPLLELEGGDTIPLQRQPQSRGFVTAEDNPVL